MNLKKFGTPKGDFTRTGIEGKKNSKCQTPTIFLSSMFLLLMNKKMQLKSNLKYFQLF